MTRRIVLALSLVLVCGNAALAETHVVNQIGNTFVPANIEAAPGDTIQWVHSSGIHTVTSGPGCSSDGRFDFPLNGGTVEYEIPGAEPDGVIPYYCIPHCGLGMVGTITVVGPPPVPTVSEWGFAVMVLAAAIAGVLIIRSKMPLPKPA